MLCNVRAWEHQASGATTAVLPEPSQFRAIVLSSPSPSQSSSAPAPSSFLPRSSIRQPCRRHRWCVPTRRDVMTLTAAMLDRAEGGRRRPPTSRCRSWSVASISSANTVISHRRSGCSCWNIIVTRRQRSRATKCSTNNRCQPRLYFCKRDLRYPIRQCLAADGAGHAVVISPP